MAKKKQKEYRLELFSSGMRAGKTAKMNKILESKPFFDGNEIVFPNINRLLDKLM